MGIRLHRSHQGQRTAASRRWRMRAPGAVEGKARLDHRTKNLIPRIKPGNIAIIDHEDLDRVAAESLLEHGVAAVVNAQSSISGRYPNIGPLILVAAGVPLLDAVGPDVFERVQEGDDLRLEVGKLYKGDEQVAEGSPLTEETVRGSMDAARTRLSETVERFAENTLDYVRKEQHILLDAVRMPNIRTDFRGRYALVVTRGHHYKEDLNALRGFIGEMKPVVVAVDGAADACLQLGIRPEVIVGDVDSVSTEALGCGAEILVHPQGEWRRRHHEGVAQNEPPEVATVKALGLDCEIIAAPGMSEDIALLLAHEQGAELIVTVGSHFSMVEFMDKGRAGMASTFLARLRLGPSLVDAKGVSLLYRTRVRTRDLVSLVLAAVITMAIVSWVMPPMRYVWIGIWDQLLQLVRSLR